MVDRTVTDGEPAERPGDVEPLRRPAGRLARDEDRRRPRRSATSTATACSRSCRARTRSTCAASRQRADHALREPLRTLTPINGRVYAIAHDGSAEPARRRQPRRSVPAGLAGEDRHLPRRSAADRRSRRRRRGGARRPRRRRRRRGRRRRATTVPSTCCAATAARSTGSSSSGKHVTLDYDVAPFRAAAGGSTDFPLDPRPARRPDRSPTWTATAASRSSPVRPERPSSSTRRRRHVRSPATTRSRCGDTTTGAHRCDVSAHRRGPHVLRQPDRRRRRRRRPARDRARGTAAGSCTP